MKSEAASFTSALPFYTYGKRIPPAMPNCPMCSMYPISRAYSVHCEKMPVLYDCSIKFRIIHLN